jgi:hypothetical protein
VVRDGNYTRVLVKEIAASVRSVEVELELTEYTLTAEPSGALTTIRLLADGPTAVSL